MRILEVLADCALRMAGPSWTLVEPPGGVGDGEKGDVSGVAGSLVKLSDLTGHSASRESGHCAAPAKPDK